MGKINSSISYLVSVQRPDLREFWSKKNILSFDEVSVGKAVDVWWTCSKGHEFEHSLKNMAGVRKYFRCSECYFLESVAYLHPEIVPMWDVERNGFSAEKSLLKNNSSVWWKCDKSHSSKRKVQSYLNDPNCYECVEKPFSKVFESYPELKKIWDFDKNPDPNKVSSWDLSLFYWKCLNGHSFTRTIYRQARLAENNCLICYRGGTIFDKTKELLPYKVDVEKTQELLYPDFDVYVYTQGFKKPVYWLCNFGHSFKRGFSDQLKNKRNCRECHNNVSSLELKVRTEVSRLFSGLKVEYNYTGLDQVYEVDLFFPELNKAIDVNGEYWHSDVIAQKNGWNSSYSKHSSKIQKCLDNGVQLVYVWEDDWNEELDKLLTALKDFVVNDSIDKLLLRLYSHYDSKQALFKK